MSAKTAGTLELEAVAKEFADITATHVRIGLGDKHSDYRDALAQVKIYKEGMRKAEDTKTYTDGKTAKQLQEEAELFHAKTPGKIRMEGGDPESPTLTDTLSKEELEEKGLMTVIDEAKDGDVINLPEVTITEDTILKDGVTLKGVDKPASEEPREGEVVLEGKLLSDTQMNLTGVTLTKDALSTISTTTSDVDVENSRILELNAASK